MLVLLIQSQGTKDKVFTIASFKNFGRAVFFKIRVTTHLWIIKST